MKKQPLIDGQNLPNDYDLSNLYQRAHDMMRNVDGLQPQEAFDELLKFLFFKQANEDIEPKLNVYTGINKSLEEDKKLANDIKINFSKYVVKFNSWFHELWKDKSFHLSDSCLVSIYKIFEKINFSETPFDIRSSALKKFLSPELRRGLGIYTTPDDVVKMMVEFIDPKKEQRIYDLACGTGTFLIESLKFLRSKEENVKYTVWGTDKNPRMLLLAELNMGHFKKVKFNRSVIDSLFANEKNEWPKENFFDVIFTNPPFGVTLENTSFDLRKFNTCRNKDGYLVNRQQSEVVFIEQSLNYLKPGGLLAIVLPKSVVTNSTFYTAQKALDKIGYIYSVVTLPPETFSTTGTQSSTVVLFIKKYEKNENKEEKIKIVLANVTNVGYDSTGRIRKQNQLTELSKDIKKCLQYGSDVGVCKLLPEIQKENTFSEIGNLIAGRNNSEKQLKLGHVVELATNGRTPGRSQYTEEGIFVVKVGNLTGNGINWIPRDRNFIQKDDKRFKNKKLVLQKGDILLTAAAHSLVYIAKKIDIINTIPSWIGSHVSFVGEVMLIRPNKKLIDPFVLLAYLRIPSTISQIQTLVRGQTAHLYPSDVLEISIPEQLLNPDKNIIEAANLIKLETELNEKLNECAFKQQKLLENISESFKS